jgi:hypothetical protein
MKTKEIVRELLKTKPSLKDDDNRLCTHIWFEEILNMNIDPYKQNTTDFLRLYAKGEFTLAPSIKRARAKLQEEEPEYRGKKYHLRKGTYQDHWRKDLGYEINK